MYFIQQCIARSFRKKFLQFFPTPPVIVPAMKLHYVHTVMLFNSPKVYSLMTLKISHSNFSHSTSLHRSRDLALGCPLRVGGVHEEAAPPYHPVGPSLLRPPRQSPPTSLSVGPHNTHSNTTVFASSNRVVHNTQRPSWVTSERLGHPVGTCGTGCQEIICPGVAPPGSRALWGE